MKTLNYLIVEINEAYDNTTTTGNGVTLITNTSIESVTNIIRQAKVVSAPEYTILKKGDEVIVHHNIFRLRNGIKGKLVSSNFFIEDNRYFVPLTEVFMYKRDGVWKSLDPYCFIKPIKSTKEKKLDGFLLSDLSVKDSLHKGNEKLKGTMSYSNKGLTEIGIIEGDTIIFSPDSEYEFMIEGELYYRMKTNDIKIKI